MPAPPAFYRTAQRPRGARSGDTDPRPGEDPDRGGQKEFVADPDGMKPTEPVRSRDGDPPESRNS